MIDMNNISPIHLRNVPPPTETFDHPEFLALLFKWLKPERYLELGVRTGECFKVVAPLCKEAIGVDILSIKILESAITLDPNMTYKEMTTDSYFKELDDDVMFDAVFIDADHSHEQSLQDFINVKDRIVQDGFIFLHDTYPYNASFIDPMFCNDVYLTALHIKQNYNDEFEQITLPFNPGFTILKRINRNKQIIWL